jgi:hypothetical protein
MRPKVLKALTHVLKHESLHPNQESSTKDLDLIKSGWGAQEAMKVYANGQEPATHERGSGVPFIGI